MTDSIFDPEQVAQLACNHFNSILPKKGKPSSGEWTTYAAIVQSEIQQGGRHKYKVVSVGTGTKCLGRNELSPLGDLVSDSHAEVLARRSFLVYLYNEMELNLEGGESILNLIVIQGVKKHFTLSPNVSFHLFISHLPCGDGAIIPSKEDTDQDQEGDQEGPSDPKKGKWESRTGAKLEAGPLVYEQVQLVGKCRVKPGKGDPTLSMSCSDKIGKWNLVGLQGSLVGNFIPEPLRLASIVIGASVPFSQECLERGIYTRFSDMFEQYVVGTYGSERVRGYSKPVVAQASVNFMDFTNVKRASASSLAWSLGFDKTGKVGEGVQVIVNGRREGATKRNFGKPSAMVDVCRKKLLRRFIDFKHLISPQPQRPQPSLSNYSQAKRMNEEYTETWSRLRAQLMPGWTTKPEHLAEFCLDD